MFAAEGPVYVMSRFNSFCRRAIPQSIVEIDAIRASAPVSAKRETISVKHNNLSGSASFCSGIDAVVRSFFSAVASNAQVLQFKHSCPLLDRYGNIFKIVIKAGSNIGHERTRLP